MKEKFRKVKLSKASLIQLDTINNIIEEYRAEGYKLTLRQLYYQLVSRDIIPNKQSEYNKISKLLKEGRMGGVVDWDAIEDRLRVPYLPYYNSSPRQAIDDAISHYRLDRQKGQDVYLEVWVEKDALSGVLKRITSKYHVNLLVNRGYGSVTAIHDAYERFHERIITGKKTMILYLGDHDPSGIDMVRDIRERISEMLNASSSFVNQFEQWDEKEADLDRWMDVIRDNNIIKDGDDIDPSDLAFQCSYGDYVKEVFIPSMFKVKPIALTMEQIHEHNPPENPAKLTDPRAEWYVKKYGYKSWEVDALNPKTLNKLLSKNIENEINMDLFNEILSQEEEDKQLLHDVKIKKNV